MKKTQVKILNPYTLKMRVYSNDGKPGDWFCKGIGQFIDLQTVQRQIRTMKANYPTKTVEFEFMHSGNLLDYNGNITGKPIIFHRRPA